MRDSVLMCTAAKSLVALYIIYFTLQSLYTHTLDMLLVAFVFCLCCFLQYGILNVFIIVILQFLCRFQGN